MIWSDVITYTNNTDFIVDMQNDFNEFNINTHSGAILAHFKSAIHANYIRKPMKEFAYLKDNITLEWYWQVMVFLLNAALTVFITYKFLNNWNPRRR